MQQLDRLLFLQGQECFFCHQPIPAAEASVEHLVAVANGGGNSDDNCVACCVWINAALGSLSIKEKMRALLSQPQPFMCPRKVATPSALSAAPSNPDKDKSQVVLEYLQRSGSARPRKVTTLKNAIAALFHKKLTDAEVDLLFSALKSHGHITVNEQKVSYFALQRSN